MPAEPEDHKDAIEPFVWTSPDGEKVTFKPFTKLRLKVFRAMRGADELEQMFLMFDAAVDDAGRGILDEQEIEKLNEIVTDWQRSSGVVLPES